MHQSSPISPPPSLVPMPPRFPMPTIPVHRLFSHIIALLHNAIKQLRSFTLSLHLFLQPLNRHIQLNVFVFEELVVSLEFRVLVLEFLEFQEYFGGFEGRGGVGRRGSGAILEVFGFCGGWGRMLGLVTVMAVRVLVMETMVPPRALAPAEPHDQNDQKVHPPAPSVLLSCPHRRDLSLLRLQNNMPNLVISCHSKSIITYKCRSLIITNISGM